MKKILVTGGSGSIGTFTIPILEDLGYHTKNYDIAEDPGNDIFNTVRLLEAMEGVDVVYHLAAIPHPYKGTEHLYRRVNYEGSINVFNCAARAKIKKFLFASSGCVYGFWAGHAKPLQLPIVEDNPVPGIEEGNTIYGYMKRAFEIYLERNSEHFGISSISLRLEGVGTHFVADHVYLSWDDQGRLPVASSVYHHFLACCSKENYAQFLKLAIEVDLETCFEAFNVGNEFVDSSIDVQSLITKHWPDIPNYVRGNQSLYSIEKAKRLLGYRPVL